MDVDITAVIIGISGIFVTVFIPSWLHYKNRKRETDIHIKETEAHITKIKLDKYDNLLHYLSLWTTDPTNAEYTNQFLNEYHRSSIYASSSVIEAIETLLTNIEEGTTDNKSQQDLKKVFLAIRKDVTSDNADFNIRRYKKP